MNYDSVLADFDISNKLERPYARKLYLKIDVKRRGIFQFFSKDLLNILVEGNCLLIDNVSKKITPFLTNVYVRDQYHTGTRNIDKSYINPLRTRIYEYFGIRE